MIDPRTDGGRSERSCAGPTATDVGPKAFALWEGTVVLCYTLYLWSNKMRIEQIMSARVPSRISSTSIIVQCPRCRRFLAHVRQKNLCTEPMVICLLSDGENLKVGSFSETTQHFHHACSNFAKDTFLYQFQ